MNYEARMITAIFWEKSIKQLALVFTEVESVMLEKIKDTKLPEKLSKKRYLLDKEFFQRRWKRNMRLEIGLEALVGCCQNTNSD